MRYVAGWSGLVQRASARLHSLAVAGAGGPARARVRKTDSPSGSQPGLRRFFRSHPSPEEALAGVETINKPLRSFTAVRAGGSRMGMGYCFALARFLPLSLRLVETAHVKRSAPGRREVVSPPGRRDKPANSNPVYASHVQQTNVFTRPIASLSCARARDRFRCLVHFTGPRTSSTSGWRPGTWLFRVPRAWGVNRESVRMGRRGSTLRS